MSDDPQYPYGYAIDMIRLAGGTDEVKMALKLSRTDGMRILERLARVLDVGNEAFAAILADHHLRECEEKRG